MGIVATEDGGDPARIKQDLRGAELVTAAHSIASSHTDEDQRYNRNPPHETDGKKQSRPPFRLASPLFQPEVKARLAEQLREA